MLPSPLYPASAPRCSFALEATHGHVLQVDDCGSPDGLCAVVLHGGPGSGSSPFLRRFFDPARYRVIAIDQRGAGRSRPRGATTHNRTADLLDDLRRVREHLGIARWLVVGGSWGATLALAHALHEPQAVSALLLRAVFLPRAEDIAAFFQDGAGHAPEAWARFAELAPECERADMLGFLARALNAAPADDGAVQRRLALAWWHWEQALGGGTGTAEAPPGDMLVDRYRVQSHYLRHGCWLDRPPLLERLGALPRVPTLLLHARDDRVCPPQAAQAVHERIAHSRLRWADTGGHDPAAPSMALAMKTALDAYARTGRFEDGETP
ncbi:alpha/beta fold hydrolase [Variovorax sp. RHLX14]|uniref:alpha/beta fold hydrolase n=1 Tax=Variovorax sp. RHLX14 TaxID=1259731 RepID=UPI003F46043C